MGRDGSEPEEIDVLIRTLALAQDTPAKAKPAAGQQVASGDAEQPPENPWKDVQLLLPSMPAPGLGRGFALASAISLPRLPDLSGVFRMPGAVTMARMWVGLGVVYSASMTFWPYPKTYLWGLVLYLLALGLVLVTGIWGARLTWQERLGSAHTVALGTVFWGIALVSAELSRQL
jgi:hypothetical protein